MSDSPYAKRLADPKDGLRYALRAAKAWRVPPTVFLGERAVDTAGWTERDSVYAMALEDYEAGLCGGCGGDLAETTKPGNQGRYVGKMSAVCHRCVALAVAADNNHPHPGALSYSVDLKTP